MLKKKMQRRLRLHNAHRPPQYRLAHVYVALSPGPGELSALLLISTNSQVRSREGPIGMYSTDAPFPNTRSRGREGIWRGKASISHRGCSGTGGTDRRLDLPYGYGPACVMDLSSFLGNVKGCAQTYG